MDAMQASHDAMLGHMALVREAMSFEPLEDTKEDQPPPPLPKPKPKESEAGGETKVAEQDKMPFFREMQPGETTTEPGELYHSLRLQGLDPEAAAAGVRRSMELGTGKSEEEIKERLRKQPQSMKEGETKVAGDVVPIQRKEPIQLWNVEKPAGYEGADPGAVSKGVIGGKIHILTPEGKRSEMELGELPTKVAGDVLQIDLGDWYRMHGPEQLQRAKGEGAGGYIESDPNAVARGVIGGKVKILTPSGKTGG